MTEPAETRTRELDLVVYGATGYTGRLVARAVADRAPAGLRWALAGRDRERLEQIRSELGARAKLIVADAHDDAALTDMARRTSAIVTTVGPYARHGTPLVAACVDAGTDLADLTGEPLWMRDTVAAFHERAHRSGARIVHACGFDSVPSDLGVWRLQAAATEKHGRACSDIVHAYGPMAGGVSGGTIASGLELLEQTVRDPNAREALADPDLLATGGTPSPDPTGPWWPQRHAGLDGWTAPFVMATTNAKAVRRTRFLLGEPWRADVRYLERAHAPTWARAATIGIGTALGTAVMAIGPVRRLAKRLLPKPGEGPSEAVRRNGFFRTTVVGHVDGTTPPVIVHTDADLDPGYDATARMLSEVGLGLASGAFDGPGGVTTPAALGGTRLVERLAEVGIRIRVA